MKEGVVTKSENAFERVQKLRTMFNDVEKFFWVIAKELCEAEAKREHKALGYKTFQEYFEDQVGRSWNTGRQLMRAYEVAVIKCKYKVEDLPNYSKVFLIAEMLEDPKENAEEWMDKAKALSSEDLKIVKSQWKANVKPEDCKHIHFEIIVLQNCHDCKTRMRRYDLEEKIKKEIYGQKNINGDRQGIARSDGLASQPDKRSDTRGTGRITRTRNAHRKRSVKGKSDVVGAGP